MNIMNALEDRTEKVIVDEKQLFDGKVIDGNSGEKEVTIVTSRLTKEEARQMFPYRPYNNYSESRFFKSF